jgi:hypothetical protein
MSVLRWLSGRLLRLANLLLNFLEGYGFGHTLLFIALCLDPVYNKEKSGKGRFL